MADIDQHFFVEASQVKGNEVRFDGRQTHHLLRSLRCRAGDELTVVLKDSRCRAYRVALDRLGGEQAVGKLLLRIEPPSPPVPSILLAQAVPKGSKMDWVIEKATELGVSAVVPLATKRTVPRLVVPSSGVKVERWRRIAEAASQQSRRWDIPRVEDITALALWLCRVQANLRLLLSPDSSDPPMKRVLQRKRDVRSIALLVGPEGGFSLEETDAAEAAGFQPANLGDRVLRTETASLAALSILTFQFHSIG